MSKNASRALAALLRWREWNESRAAITLAQSSQKLESAKANSRAQLETVTDIQQRRGRMLEGSIDPAILQFAADIENDAWRALEAYRADEALARDRQTAAHKAFLDARARTRVVQARHARVAAAERDHREKVVFDRMADLHVLNRRHAHD